MEYTGQNGFYCCRYLTEGSKILLSSYLNSMGLDPSLEFPFHSTSIFSDSTPSKLALDGNTVFVETTCFSLLGKSLVLILNSKTLEKHFNKWLSLGCIHTFDSYIPHITVIDDVEKANLTKEYLEELFKLPVSLTLFLDREECSDLQN